MLLLYNQNMQGTIPVELFLQIVYSKGYFTFGMSIQTSSIVSYYIDTSNHCRVAVYNTIDIIVI